MVNGQDGDSQDGGWKRLGRKKQKEGEDGM